MKNTKKLIYYFFAAHGRFWFYPHVNKCRHITNTVATQTSTSDFPGDTDESDEEDKLGKKQIDLYQQIALQNNCVL